LVELELDPPGIRASLHKLQHSPSPQLAARHRGSGI